VSALLKELAVIGLALLVSAGAIQLLRDRAVLVPPPEKVVEEFVHEISLERWASARNHLTGPLARRLGPDSLRAFRERLEQRVGRIDDVRGRPLFATDAAAEAAAEVTTTTGDRARLRFPLSREHGLWKISRLDLGT
jgi:hypothetical protein